MLPAAIVHAEQICKPDSIPASTPDSQLIDNGDGTITDSKTGLMSKKCVEGLFDDNCGTGTASYFTWNKALQKPITVNDSGGFGGHTDWRLPNINELVSLVEEQCSYPAINLTRFPNMPNFYFWSSSPVAGFSVYAWYVNFDVGNSYFGHINRSGYYDVNYRYYGGAVRLVRGGN